MELLRNVDNFLQKYLNLSDEQFQNGFYKFKFVQRFHQNSQNNAHMTISFYQLKICLQR